MIRQPRRLALAVLAALALGPACGQRVIDALHWLQPPPAAEARPCTAAGPRVFPLPAGGYKGINYGSPHIADGDYVGLEYLRSGTGTDDYWSQAKPALGADLDFIQQEHLGSVIRLFLGLDQAMVWDPATGFKGFYPQVLDNLAQALAMVRAHHLKAIVVLYDQEEQSSLGNFRFQALDGRHPDMRAGYLRATAIFMRRFGEDPTVIGWDLFNEAYNNLTGAGGLPRPPHPDPVSPNYSYAVVHQWLRDLYRAAKCAAPEAWLTVSDATELYHKSPPNIEPYNGAVDFYDVHVYENDPHLPDWRRLGLPIIIGEAGAQLTKSLSPDPRRDAAAVTALLDQGRLAGASAVLLHGEDYALYSPDHRRLTTAGVALADFHG